MSRYRRFIPLLLLLAVPSGPAFGARPKIEPRIESVTATGYRAIVSFPEPVVLHGTVFGQALDEITIAGGSAAEPAGDPQLPTITLLLHAPPGAVPRVVARPGNERSLGVLRPVPLPHLLSDRDTWVDLSAASLAAYLDNPGYRWGPSAGAEPPLLARSVSTAEGDAPVVQVTLRPVRWDPRTGEARFVEQAVLEVSWDPGVRGAGPRGATVPLRSRAVGQAYVGPLRVQPARLWVRLGILRPGLYELSAADLEGAGVSTPGIDPATFRLFRATPGDLPESVSVELAPDSLRECAIIVSGEGDGVFDPGDRIHFYATGSTGFGYDLSLGGSADYQDPQRSGEESLWLTWGPGPLPSPPLRMASRDAAPVSPATTVTQVPHRVHFEENRIQDFDLFRAPLRWERWFYRLMSQGSRVAFPLALPGTTAGDPGSLAVRMWGKGISIGATPGLEDHVTNLYWNSSLVASASWNFTNPMDLAASGFTVRGNDTLLVEVPRIIDDNDPNRFDQSNLAWFEITYQRRLAAINDTLRFGSDPALSGTLAYTVTGITDTTAAWLLDRTDPENPARLVNGTYSGAPGPFTLLAQDSLVAGSPRRYSLVSTARALRPATIARFSPPVSSHAVDDLLDPASGADYLIITAPALLAAAESLAAYREGRLEGFASPRVAIATTDRIGSQFGAGYLDPVAIRNLIAYARLHWPAPAPAYVCLFGDASLDPRNYLGFGTPDLVPAYANYFDQSLVVQYISDDFYGFLDGPGDLVLDLAVGRLPAKNGAEGVSLARGKIQAFEAATELHPWRARALLSADDSWKRELRDGLGNDHVIQMERKDHQHIPFPIERSKVYLNDYAFADTSHQTKPAALEEFISRINQGNWLVDYIGHGSSVVVADERLFRSTDVGRLTNASRPSIFGFFSCTVGKFDVLGQEGLGELLLKIPGGGAVASIAATEKVVPFESTALNDEIVDQLFLIAPRVDSTRTLGEAFKRAKNAHLNQIVRKYVLLGDPALGLPIPRGRAVWEKAPLDSILRGDLAIVKGHALNPDSSADTLGSGSAVIQVQGKPSQRIQIGLNDFGVLAPTTYEVPGPVIYRGSVTLQAGEFEARFVIPLDGRVAGGQGQLRALLSEAGGLGVGLGVDSLRIAVGVGTRVDLAPPTISLRYPSPSDSSVQSGDRLTIVIEDSSGVDLMRLDNAHTIFVIMDDRGSPTELTAGFAYEPGSHTRGSVDFVLPQLGEGLHTMEVHASDNFGNIGVRTFVLDLHAPAVPGDPVQLTQVFNYPNPFEGTTYVHARLNQAAHIRVQILTVAGRRVRELSADGKAGENYLPWDGKDSSGENVAIGVYLLRVTAESPTGKRAQAVGRALRSK